MGDAQKHNTRIFEHNVSDPTMICFMVAILKIIGDLESKHYVIWERRSVEGSIIVASDDPPRIKEFSAVSEHFCFKDLAPDDCLLKFTIEKIVFRSSSGLSSAVSFE